MKKGKLLVPKLTKTYAIFFSVIIIKEIINNLKPFFLN